MLCRICSVIRLPFGSVEVASSSDGRTIAFGAPNAFGTQEQCGLWIQTSGEPAARKYIGNQTGSTCDVSPDGRMVAGAGSFGLKVLMCEENFRQVYSGSRCVPKFSRDGKKLLADGKLLSTDTFVSDKRLDGAILYGLSADATIPVGYLQSGSTCLINVETSKIIARFQGVFGISYLKMSGLAKADDDKITEIFSDHIRTLHVNAETLAGCDISLRSPVIAMKLVDRMLALQSDFEPIIAHTIGRVLYQNDRFDEAIVWLESNLAKGESEYDGFDAYVLAMAYAKSGKAQKAAKSFERAGASPVSADFDLRDRRELSILRAEAKHLLAIEHSN